MCLFINKFRHSTETVQHARTVTSPILVYKVLEHVNDTQGNSPYRNTVCKFGKVLTEKNMTLSRQMINIINEGYHSCRTMRSTRNHTYRHSSRVVYGIIPVGAKMWYGNDDDIVSNKLILYRTKEALEAVHGKIGAPRKHTSLTSL